MTFLLTIIVLPIQGSAQMEEINKELLKRHLEKIVGERTAGLSDQHLEEVFLYVKETLAGLGYEIELDLFSFEGGRFENIIGRKKGGVSEERIIVGAHFDTVPGSPGADDNASGVAVMLELARMLADRKWNHTVEFIGFHMEEWNMIGSDAYAKKLRARNVQVRGMISLEMVGFTSDQPKSQKMPAGFGLFYPDVGNFIAIVGNVRSWKFLNRFKAKMKETEGLPVESLIIPFNGIFLYATRWSDHSPFWDQGYPALLITDTSFYRNPHYHGPSDTIDTLDLDFMQSVTRGVAKALVALDEV
ncbi:MAG: M20/M25/M40 family metallo-hydrolase [Candidatus Omnitrophica bacterium]|nr:M20/M25/M40 family metallo-hydrolase [Candidatus Omnitrophota bacterium]